MANYRADQYVTSLEKLYDQKNQSDDDPQLLAETSIQDLFFPISEKLALTDTVEVAYFTPATFVWGNGTTINAGWAYNGGGRWNAA